MGADRSLWSTGCTRGVEHRGVVIGVDGHVRRTRRRINVAKHFVVAGDQHARVRWAEPRRSGDVVADNDDRRKFHQIVELWSKAFEAFLVNDHDPGP